MFVFRSAFWITVVLLLLPAEEQTASQKAAAPVQSDFITTTQAFDAAKDTFSDVSGFCERNPKVCVAGGDAFNLLQRKAKYAARVVYNWAHSDGPSQKTEHSAANTSEQTRSTHARNAPQKRSTSRNTLGTNDLKPTWQGPGDFKRT